MSIAGLRWGSNRFRISGKHGQIPGMMRDSSLSWISWGFDVNPAAMSPSRAQGDQGRTNPKSPQWLPPSPPLLPHRCITRRNVPPLKVAHLAKKMSYFSLLQIISKSCSEWNTIIYNNGLKNQTRTDKAGSKQKSFTVAKVRELAIQTKIKQQYPRALVYCAEVSFRHSRCVNCWWNVIELKIN